MTQDTTDLIERLREPYTQDQSRRAAEELKAATVLEAMQADINRAQLDRKLDHVAIFVQKERAEKAEAENERLRGLVERALDDQMTAKWIREASAALTAP